MNQDGISEKKIDRLMKDYLQQDENYDEGCDNDDLVVDFDISYPNGKAENYVCGRESDIFKVPESNQVENNHDEDDVNSYINNLNNINMNVIKSEENCKIYEKDYHGNYDEYEFSGKWDNCEEEIKEKSFYEPKHSKTVKEERTLGNITVYSTLEAINGTRIRGVKINLYKINGVSTELVASSETDSEGKVNFADIPEGNYRIIELIDKRYFNKPAYVNWNEVRIDHKNKDFTVYAINSVNEKCKKFKS